MGPETSCFLLCIMSHATGGHTPYLNTSLGPPRRITALVPCLQATGLSKAPHRPPRKSLQVSKVHAFLLSFSTDGETFIFPASSLLHAACILQRHVQLVCFRCHAPRASEGHTLLRLAGGRNHEPAPVPFWSSPGWPREGLFPLLRRAAFLHGTIDACCPWRGLTLVACM